MLEEHFTPVDEPLAGLARRLLAARTGGWTEDGARALVDGLGLRRAGPADGASPDGPRLRPVGPSERRYAEGRAHLELAVPAGRGGPDAAGHVLAFGRARTELTDELGEASVIGLYGSLGPYYGPTPAWGAPFLRWRGPHDTLELRAGRRGPEVVLRATAPLEDWYLGLGHGEENAIGGFLGTRRAPSTAGMSLPGRWSARSWETVTGALAAFLTTLPAEFAALGIAKVMRLYGRTGGGAPRLFDIDADSRLMLASFADHDADPAAAGWGTVAEHPGTRETWADDHEPRWRLDAGGPGEPDGRALAGTLVATARAAGVATPGDLLLGSEAEDIGPYRVTFHGLGLATV
ncbi:hypothetical protein [Kitasatospora sp. NPDC005748]|uniref:hypothetical protein n=1 Tax=Kitasatospora sp. NPDC005748 TaxID=3157063 RepID=UPI0034090567